MFSGIIEETMKFPMVKVATVHLMVAESGVTFTVDFVIRLQLCRFFFF